MPYDDFRLSPRDPFTIRHADVERWLGELSAKAVGRIELSRLAESYAGRAIYLATIGGGPRRVLVWSQMHGDEPTYTAVLVDLLSYLVNCADDRLAAEILAGCTLHMIPMLNPDGAAMVTRFNAQGIDVNRDARRLATPEGRALRRALHTLRPEFAFNLHNQNARTAAGDPPRPVVLAVMTPPLDAANSQTPQLRSAKQVAAGVVATVWPKCEGMVSRYAAEFMPGAFGEAAQASGVVTVLIEAGGWPETDPAPMVELHFDALVAALRAIAADSYRDVDPADYDALPTQNDKPLYDCLVTGGHVFDPRQQRFWRADLAINHSHGNRLVSAPKPDGKIVDIGDMPGVGAKQVIDATDCLIVPGRQPEETGPLKVQQLQSSIDRGKPADLLIFALSGAGGPVEVLDQRRLKRVIVAGATVWSASDASDGDMPTSGATSVEEVADA